MQTTYLLGIDAGGTHTDGVVVEQEDAKVTILAEAKVSTDHNNLTNSMDEVLEALQAKLAPDILKKVTQVSLGTTLAVNALVQGKTDPVGLLLTAGPGLSPKRFVLDTPYMIVPGGCDHRGVEVTPLNTTNVPKTLEHWMAQGIKSVACVGKFSPRTTAHEQALGECCAKAGLNYTLGHRLSGVLNFPRRIATAYYNAAVQRIQNSFLDAVVATLEKFQIQASVRLLKADGGAIPLELARTEPVQSILSGPAASVLGIMALCPEVDQGVSLLLDVGGTTTDIAVIINGSPVLDRDGMLLNGRRTLVRALAANSIGVGGDSQISVKEATVKVGPTRLGPAMAFGGDTPSLTDALNVLELGVAGDRQKSKEGIEKLAEKAHMSCAELCQKALESAVSQIDAASKALIDHINAHPIYTLAQLRTHNKITLDRVILVGGPAPCLKEALASQIKLPVLLPQEFAVANAIGACLTSPTESLEVYADTGKGVLQAPKLGHSEKIRSTMTQHEVEQRALELLQDYMAKHASLASSCEILESHLFATLNDFGRSSKDMRVTCQAIPGILARPTRANCAL